jgi:hypothetical protein
MNRKLIQILRPFVDALMDAPFPTFPGADANFYLEVESLRCADVSEMCADLVEAQRARLGNRAADIVRDALEPIRLELLQRYPSCANQLNPGTWPAPARRH